MNEILRPLVKHYDIHYIGIGYKWRRLFDEILDKILYEGEPLSQPSELLARGQG